MSTLLNSLQTAANCRWNSKPLEEPVDADILKKAVEKHRLPEEYLDLIKTVRSLEIFGPEEVIHFFSVKDVYLINDDPAYKSDLPFLFFFGDDKGERLYAFDPDNEWRKGVNAIFLIEMGSLSKEDACFLGKDLHDLLIKLDDGTDFSKLPTLGEE